MEVISLENSIIIGNFFNINYVSREDICLMEIHYILYTTVGIYNKNCDLIHSHTLEAVNTARCSASGP